MKKLLLLISMTAACLTAQAAISVGPGGSGVLDLGTAPAATEWATAVLAGNGATIVDVAGLDAAVSALTAAGVVTTLPTSGTPLPSTSALGFRYNTANSNIQSRVTTVAGTILKATLQNDTLADQSAITVSYTLGSGQLITEQIPGFRAYYSLSGNAGTWVNIPALSTDVPGIVTGVINLGNWPAGSTMYLLWADDNADPGTDGHYTIDDFSVTPGGTITEAVTITSPTNTATRPFGAPIVITASATMAGTISGVEFFLDNVSIGTDTTAPYSVTNIGAALGAHQIRATATDNTHSINSAIVNFTVVANNPATVTLTAPIAGTNVLVGTTVDVAATATDADGAVVHVDFYVDGVLKWTDTTSGYTFAYCDSLAGAHTISAVALDNSGGLSTNSTTITVTNQPGVTIVLTNGAEWKYFEGGSDPGLGWETLAFNDSGWSNGHAELGYGDTDANRPETTVIGFGVDPNLKHAAAYFRKTFSVANASSFTGLVVRILRDDHAIVRLNGAIIYNDMTNVLGTINHLTYEQPSAGDDGNVYQTSITNNALINGLNILAVEVHQNTTNSSDLSFDMMLWGVAPTGAQLTVTQINPTQVEVSWPLSTPAGPLLYFTTDLTPPQTWSMETALDVPSGGFHRVVVTTGTKKFWTLRQ